MADTKREIERKYELPGHAGANGASGLPDLTRVSGVSSIFGRGVTELDAVYYDTPDLRLAAGSLTLRRRTGGEDAGWHLKFPVSTGIRDEIRAPLADTLPADLSGLLRSRVRGAELAPVVRVRSSRDVCHLLDTDGVLLAEVSIDSVRAERLMGGSASTSWTEVEVELADDGDPAFLDAVEKKLRKAGLRPASAPSKLARALAETAPRAEPAPWQNGRRGQDRPRGRGKEDGRPGRPGRDGKAGRVGKAGHAGKAGRGGGKAAARTSPVTAADHVLAYLRTQAEAIIAQDPAVRRDLPDSVHQMRVATRRMRSAFRTYRKVLDRSFTDPIAAELKWLAAELGVDRDQEVLDERLRSRIDGVPATLLLGPVSARLQAWSVSRRAGTRKSTVTVLDSDRYLALLETFEELLADPPLLGAAGRAPGKVLPKAVVKDYDRLAARVGHALELPPGGERDVALHEARKAAKRVRYAAEAARPALGRPARRFAKRMQAVQQVLGDHQDSVVARDTLRELAIHAHAAGEAAFSWGLLYGQEAAQAESRERELPGVWAKASRPALRKRLRA